MTRMFRLYDASVTKRCERLLGLDRKEERENTAFSGIGLDIEAAPVPVHDVLHNGEAEAGPAELPRSCRIDPVEPFGQAGDMLPGDPFALVRHAEGDHRLGCADALEPLAAGDGVIDPLKSDA